MPDVPNTNNVDQVKNLNEYIKGKAYPLPYVNNQGFRWGNFMIQIDHSKLPFSSTDQVDLYLMNLFNYVKKAPNNKLDRKEFNKQFLKNNDVKIFSVKPIKYRKQTKKEKDTADAAKKAKEDAAKAANATNATNAAKAANVATNTTNAITSENKGGKRTNHRRKQKFSKRNNTRKRRRTTRNRNQ
jgi:hypothetical protein